MSRYTREDEQTAHSALGVVKDEEHLLRVIYAPEHIRNGSVIESAIALEDLKERGFSLDRASYVDDAVIQQRIAAQTDRKPDQRQSNFIAQFECVSVRNISDESNEQAFIVIDTAQDDNLAHASLYSANANLGRGGLRKLRDKLLPLLQESF